MRAQAFLLGLFSVAGQVLLLRVLISAFGGNELVIGVGLFGWMLAVALGAWTGGRRERAESIIALLVFASLLLLVEVALIRFLPGWLTGSPGMTVAVGWVVILSAVLSMPVAWFCGRLFSAISRHGWTAARGVSNAYLWEGLGSFAGGLAVTALVGTILSSLGAAIALGAAVVGASIIVQMGHNRAGRWIAMIMAILLAILSDPIADNVERELDRSRWAPFEVLSSFDTPYGHQAILEREGLQVLVTDNHIEGTIAIGSTAENLLLGGLLHIPGADNIVWLGRAETGLMQLAEQLGRTEIIAVDPRARLTHKLNNTITLEGAAIRIDNDPLRFMKHSQLLGRADLILIDLGQPGSYHRARLATARFLLPVYARLRDSGVAVMAVPYDTDRYVSPEAEQALQNIWGAWTSVFPHYWVWPGETTLLFGSSQPLDTLTARNLVERLESMSYQPQFLRPEVLWDRLGDLKVDRLHSVIADDGRANSLTHPRLLTSHLVYQSRTTGGGSVLAWLLSHWWWLLLPAAAVLAWMVLTGVRSDPHSFTRLLLIIGGFASLSLELVSLYLYQSVAGSLYSEMGVLFGAFMLGLAVGAALGRRIDSGTAVVSSLTLGLLATLALWLSYGTVVGGLLIYHVLFLFTIAAAAGSLFVGATHLFYGDAFAANYGSSYAWEITGSAVAALLTMPILLPMIGLHGLLAVNALLLAGGLVLTVRGGR